MAQYEKSYLRSVAAEAIENLFAAAESNGIELIGVSGYRSYETQQVVFASNVEKYGSRKAANQVSAIPGQSEHQTGLTMDVSSKSFGYRLSTAFGSTKAGQWLAANAWKYGFIIRYKKGTKAITGYSYEPWHIRYVGKKAAEVIHKNEITLEQYLGV